MTHAKQWVGGGLTGVGIGLAVYVVAYVGVLEVVVAAALATVVVLWRRAR